MSKKENRIRRTLMAEQLRLLNEDKKRQREKDGQGLLATLIGLLFILLTLIGGE